jgi:hypothetical protein
MALASVSVIGNARRPTRSSWIEQQCNPDPKA